MYARALAAALGAAVAACRPEYVHVIVDGTDMELMDEEQPRTVLVRAYGGAHTVEADYPSNFRETNSFFRTDFNLVFEDGAPETIDLRVAVLDAPDDWAGTALVARSDEGEVHILLSPAELRLSATDEPVREVTGDLASMTRFGTGFAIGWPVALGVRLLTRDDPELAAGRPGLIPDDSPRQLRLASRPTSYDPDLMAMSWISQTGQEGMAKLQIRTTDETSSPLLPLGTADDIWPAVAPSDAPFAVATVTRLGDAITLACHDENGADLGKTQLTLAADGIQGFVVGPGGRMIVALDDGGGGLLVQAMPTATGPPCSSADELAPVMADVHAMALSADRDLLFTVQRDTDLFLQAYELDDAMAAHGDREAFAKADPAPLPTLYQQLTISSCAVVWPARRDDGAEQVIDLWARDLDSQGRPREQARVVNARFELDHFTPTVSCRSLTPYATFLSGEQANREIAVRKLPPPLLEELRE